MYKKLSELRREKMFWESRKYGEAVHLTDKNDLKGCVTFYAVIRLKKGKEIGYHQHCGEKELFHFLEGQGEINDNGQIVHVSPGDVIITPVDGWHAFKNTGNRDLVFTALIIKSEK